MLRLSLILLFMTSCSGSSTQSKKDEAQTPQTSPDSAASKTVMTEKTVAPAQASQPEVEPSLSASDSSNRSSKKIICKFVQEERTLEVVPLDEDGGCRLIYTKYNESSEKARAISETDICYNVLNKIRANIEAYGFDCRPAK